MNIELPVEQLIAYCEQHNIRRLSVFGSALRDDFTEKSDLDLLVEYDPEAIVTFLDMATQEIELSEITGYKVDLRTPEDLSHFFRQEVVENAELVYEKNQ
jgi:hypothetical protein